MVSVFRGLGFLLSRPSTWPWALVPAVVLVSLGTLLVWASLGWLRPALRSFVGSGFGGEVVSWTITLIAALLGLMIAVLITPPLSGPALERIVAIQERELGVPARGELGLLSEIWCGLRAQLFAAIFALPSLFLLWLLEISFPPAAIVTAPLAMIVVSLSVAWNLFDYPLTLRGVRMRDRFALVMTHKRACLGFGAAFAALFWVPCFGVVLLPVGVAAATRLLWQLLDADPSLLPSLARSTAQDRSIAMPS
jgi:CysZ protein